MFKAVIQGSTVHEVGALLNGAIRRCKISIDGDLCTHIKALGGRSTTKYTCTFFCRMQSALKTLELYNKLYFKQI